MTDERIDMIVETAENVSGLRTSKVISMSMRLSVGLQFPLSDQ